MVQDTSAGGTPGRKPYCPEEIGDTASTLWESVGQPTSSDTVSRNASDLSEMAVRRPGPGEARQDDGEAVGVVVRRLVAEKHQEHFSHFVLETKVVEAGLALGIEVVSYPNLHVHRHHVWVTCSCGATLLLE